MNAEDFMGRPDKELVAALDTLAGEERADEASDQPDAVAGPMANTPSAPLFVTTARNGASSARSTHLNKPSVIAARKNATR